MTDTEDNDKSIILFGHDISRIPCFRSTFLYGISGGIAAGLTFFMFTSRVQMASHVGMGIFTLTTFAYWFPCRYYHSQRKFEMQQLQTVMKNHILNEGTNRDENRKNI